MRRNSFSKSAICALLFILNLGLALAMKDITGSFSDVNARALALEGNVGAQSNSLANAARVASNPGIHSQNSQDEVGAISLSESDAVTGRGNALGISTAGANAYNQAVGGTPVQYGQNAFVGALAGAATLAGTNQGDAAAVSNSNANTSNLRYDQSGQMVQQNQSVQFTPSSWYNTRFKVNHVSIGAVGDVYCVAEDKTLKFYDMLTEKFVTPKTDYSLTGITRVAVNHDGTLYALTLTGETYYLNCSNKWIRLDGCATDIAVGLYGEVYKVGCDVQANGLGIYKLFCTGDPCFKSCKRHRLSNLYNDFDDDRKCEWFRTEGSGVGIEVCPSGYPVVTRTDHSIWGYDGSDWYAMGDLKAQDICCSNDGTVYAAGVDSYLYKMKVKVTDKNLDIKAYSYTRVNGISNVSAVACKPHGLPLTISSNTFVHSYNTIYN